MNDFSVHLLNIRLYVRLDFVLAQVEYISKTFVEVIR